MSSSLIDQHIAKLRLESALIDGAERKICSVPSPHHPFAIVSAGVWGIAHLPSGRQLVPCGLTQRQAFERAMELYNGGRDAGLVMADPLPPQLAALTLEDLRALKPAARAYIETLCTLLAGTTQED